MICKGTYDNQNKGTNLTHMLCALINVVGAIVACETGSTFAFKVGKVIHAVPAVLAPVWRLGAKGDLRLAVLALILG